MVNPSEEPATVRFGKDVTMFRSDGTHASSLERRQVFDLAEQLWNDGSQLRKIRAKLGLTKAEIARRARISLHKLNAYEQPGPVNANFWQFCNDVAFFFNDRRIFDDPIYRANLLESESDPKTKLV